MNKPLRSKFARVLVAVIAAVALWPVPSVTEERAPLLMEGKTALYQRVLTRPGARMHAEPTAVGAETARSVTAFSVYYVYDRKVIQDQEWVEVGPKGRGGTLGWMPTDDTIAWKQTMTAAFTPRVGRERALFFRDDEELWDLLESELLLPTVEKQRAAIADGDLPEGFPVIAIEPAAFVDFGEQFYLLPILSAEEVWLDSGFTVRLLEVASIPLSEGEEQDLADPEVRRESVEDVGDQSDQIKDFAAAIAFVMDTTVSMDPYIDRSREVVRSIYQAIEGEGLLPQVSFALVGFRDDIKARPDLEYVSKVFADFTAGHDPQQFLSLVEAVEEARTSTRGFVEDSYAGVLTALDRLSWDEYGLRIIVLITDAGPRRANDPYGQTGLDAEQLRSYARDKGVAIWPIHLRTPEGRNDHESAAAQYALLSEFEREQLYTPIEAGSVEHFGPRVGQLAQSVVQTIAKAAQGQLEQEPPAVADAVHDFEDEELAEIERKVQHVGRVMQLAWLGKKTEAQAPRVFRAWLVDRDLESPQVPTVEVRVFLTKDQLSDMQQTLKAILEAGESAREGSMDFFNQIRSAAAAMGRDPSVVGRDDARNLVELGLLGEYLDGLPYQSKIMAIDEDFWHELSIGDQQAFIDELKAKINLYETYHDDTDRWLDLGDERIETGDTVYPVPLEDLP